MTEQELEERYRVRDEARKWLGTPYHHRMAKLGVGVDCAMLLHEAFRGAGFPVQYEMERYTSDWHLHRDEEKYLSVVTRYAPGDLTDHRPISERQPGFIPVMSDVLMWKVGLTFSHSALVTDWPYVIHASLPDRMVIEVDVHGTVLFGLPMILCSYWGSK